MTGGGSGPGCALRSLIVGASQGIGAAAARHFASQGARLVTGARNVRALEALRDELRGQGHEVDVIRIDVSDRATIDAVAQRA
ncbi:SDR family NAD(P)-dependent oxidoreductase [Streptomyces sp. NPDC058686]|uniref:SDR family NAD(P)-dependent oxidoreductase n=1 Tax=Streptomyces sp. NPDC058686 TaxID=3346599 RepID=UPI003661BAB8